MVVFVNGIIPNVGEYFSFVASEIYYDNNLLEDIINNLQTILISVQKNGVRCCYGYFNGNKILRKSEFLFDYCFYFSCFYYILHYYGNLMMEKHISYYIL